MKSKKPLSNITIICDSREKKNKHITDWFDKNNIKWRVEKLDVGDYTFVLEDYPELDVDYKFVIEKKADLSELAGNFTKGRDRFEREFQRSIDNGQKVHLVIENATFRKLLNGSYRSKFTPKAFMASLLSWTIRNNLQTWFVTPKDSGEIIYNLLYYELYEHLKKL